MFKLALVVITIFLLAKVFCGCEPIDITDPTPTWYRTTLESSTEEYSSGLIGLESAIPLLEAENVDFTQPIHIREVYFTIRRESVDEVDTLTPYFLYVGDILADTVAVADGTTTHRFYDKVRKTCKDPYWRVQSDHNVMVTVEMLLYVFKN